MHPSSAMAGAHCATASFLSSFATATPISRRRVSLLSTVSTLSPSRLTKRTNHLRQKLLKTITKPYPNTLLPQSPHPISIDSPPEQQQKRPESLLSDQFVVEELKESEELEIRASEPSEVVRVFDCNVGKFPKYSVFKFGLWFIGAFVFQTICAGWLLGSADFDRKDGNLDSEDRTASLETDSNEHGETKSQFLFEVNGDAFWGNSGTGNGGFLYVDKSELERKINEIRVMAREARERERLEWKANDFDGNTYQDDDDDVSSSNIGKEVDGRLVRLKKVLKNSYETSPLSFVNYLNKDGEVENGIDKDGLDVQEGNGALMFQKKYKFRSPRPKGFMGVQDLGVSDMEDTSLVIQDGGGSIESDGGDSLPSNNEQQVDLPAVDLEGNVSLSLEKDTGSELQKEEYKSMGSSSKKLGRAKRRIKVANEMGGMNNDATNGILQESNGGPMVKSVKPKESSQLEAQNSESIEKGDHAIVAMSNKHYLLNRNGTPRSRKVDSKRTVTKQRDKNSNSEIDLRWLSLPYVLAILMRRGLDGEGPQGLYTLKGTSQEMGSSSHTVVFEDRGDATNFCYLLQSFFEDLDDFSVEIVPLPIKEFSEAVKSHAMKVLLVKKGQLQLYAGQPLADVEMALRSFIGQS